MCLEEEMFQFFFVIPSKHNTLKSWLQEIVILYTGCPGRNVRNFRRVFLMLKYTDITQNTYIQSWTVTEIMARETCGLLWGRRTVAASWQPQHARPSVWYRITSRALSLSNLHTFRLLREYSSQICCTVLGWRQRWAIHMSCIVAGQACVMYSVWKS
jgi:hypothetical protein